MAILFISLLILLLIGVPVAFTLGLSPLIYFLTEGGVPKLLFPLKMFNNATIFYLMAIPFFIMAGNLMNACGITRRLVQFSRNVIGFVRGGLGMVSIVASMFFGGVTGSANAEAAAIGSILIPAMAKDGYKPEKAAAIVVTASVIGPIIPPSIAFIMYGVLANVSITELFLAGFVPGILLGFALMIITYIYAVRNNLPKGPVPSFKDLLRSFKDAIIALLMPLIILGGILSGIFTPTEAGAVAVVYAIIVGFFIYRELTIKKFVEIIFEGAVLSASVLMIVSAAGVLGYVLTVAQLPVKMSNLILSVTHNKYVFLLMINVFLLLIGTFLEPTAAQILLIPILAPLAKQFGIHLTHFGVILSMNLIIGLITPPVGSCLYIGSTIARRSFERVFIAMIPFLLTCIFVLFLITYVDGLVMLIPNLFMK